VHRAAVALLLALAGCPLPDEPEKSDSGDAAGTSDSPAPDSGDDSAAPDTAVTDTAAAAPPSLFVNEFLADNRSVNVDDVGEHSPWIELYNAGETDAPLDGLRLTDDFDATGDTLDGGLVVPAGGWLILWADGRPELGDTHLEVELGRDGGQIGVWYGEDWLQKIEYGNQSPDLSSARVPDGSMDWVAGAIPTPGETNGG
jgi:hypothetical protein